MATLVCDLCGGKLVIGSGGVAICESCGMEHSAVRMKEKVQEIKGVVPVENPRSVENFLLMARNAYDSGNKAETENYCNKILETDPMHRQAWLLKGKAAGWQSTLGNIRLPEAINCFANAIANTEEAEKESVIRECMQEVREISEALIRLRGERFAKWPDAEEKNGFVSDLTAILQAILQFFKTVGAMIDKDELMASLAKIINDAVMSAWYKEVRPTFANDHNGHPNDYAFQKLLERAGHCTDLLEQAVDLSESDLEGDIQFYKNLIIIHEYMIDACSYSYETVDAGTNWVDGSTKYENRYVRSKGLTEAAKNHRRQLIATYEQKILEKKRAAFWTHHGKEHQFLVEELEKSKRELDKLEKAQTSHTKAERLRKHISEIEKVLKSWETNLKIEPSERKFVENCKGFWEKLESENCEYDDYLDRNPVLKQAPEITKQYVALLRTRYSIEQKKKSSTNLSWLWLIGVAYGFCMIMLGDLFYGWVAVILFGSVSCYRWVAAKKRKADILDQEASFARIAGEYNATIDQMLAVPKFTGRVKSNQAIQIPPKIDFSPSQEPTRKSIHIPAFVITLIVGIAFGYTEVSTSSNGFSDAYRGVLSFIVGSEIWTSGIAAGIIWAIVVLAASFGVGKLVSHIQEI